MSIASLSSDTSIPPLEVVIILFPLKEKIPNDRVIVAESGLYSYEQLLNLSQNGVRGFLIGEHFMRQDDIYKAVMEIKNER